MLGTSRRGCAAALLALAFVIASAIAPPGRAQAPDPAGTTADVVVFEPVDGQGLIGVADRGLFRGRVAVRGSSSGLIVVNELAPQDYLRGLAEVPPSWPLEAQKAQAVAARTYMLYERAGGHWNASGADICATDACQVYRGADREPGTPLWQEAVRQTEGQVLLYQGSPILARYFSTSGGRTRSNLEVFGNDVPYLQGVPDPEDAVSPLHHWVVTFALGDLEASLRSRAETSPPPGRLVDVSRAPGGPLVVTTEEEQPGSPEPLRHSATLDATRVMIRLNNDAPRRYPGRYPGPTENGNGRLPLTVPDDGYVAATQNGVATFDGRGWGHKVGMSQYGAKGKAEKGLSAAQILAAYYSGLTPATYPMPPTVRVLISDGIDSATMQSTGAFRVVDGAGRVISPSTLGGWEVRPQGGRVRVTPPAGSDRPLTLAAAAPVPTSAPNPVVSGVPGGVRVSLSAPARVEPTLEGPGGTRRLPVKVLDAGDRVLVLADLFNRVLPAPGSYRLRVVATDTRGGRAESVVDLAIPSTARAVIPTSDALFGARLVASGDQVGPAPAGPRASTPPSGRGGSGVPLSLVGAVAALVMLAVGLWRVRVWRDRADPVADADAAASTERGDPG